MHLAVDAVGIKHSGGAIVLRDLLDTAIADERIGKITVFCSPRSVRDFDIQASSKLVAIEKPAEEDNYLSRMLWQQSRLGRVCIGIEADLVLCFTGTGVGGPGTPHVTFIQQTVPFAEEVMHKLPLLERGKMVLIRRLMAKSCATSEAVIVQTPTMREWISHAARIPRERILVRVPSPPLLPNDASHEDPVGVMERTPKGGRLLYVGSTQPQKNVELIARAMPGIRGQVPGSVLFATWDPSHRLCDGNTVIGLGYLNRATLRHAYSRADVLIMPSLAETVGLPMLEAMDQGVLVLASDRPFAHDICGDGALFFDPLDMSDYVKKAVTALTDHNLRKSTIRRANDRTAQLKAARPYEEMLNDLYAAARRRVVHAGALKNADRL